MKARVGAASSPASPRLAGSVVEDFGREWSTFDQSPLDPEELNRSFHSYFSIFPWDALPAGAAGLDIGCGSGRWARLVAPRVGILHCMDASVEALSVARRNLSEISNCTFTVAAAEQLPFAESTMDFGYSLGVLHHTVNPRAGLLECVRALKPGAPLLIYLYYRFDGRPAWYRGLWQITDGARRIVSRASHPVKLAISNTIAAGVYWPLARVARLLERSRVNVTNFPLAFYRKRSFYTMRTDALDRFGTRIEHRFTAEEIRTLMEGVGLQNVIFSSREPFWCAVGWKPVAA